MTKPMTETWANRAPTSTLDMDQSPTTMAAAAMAAAVANRERQNQTVNLAASTSEEPDENEIIPQPTRPTVLFEPSTESDIQSIWEKSSNTDMDSNLTNTLSLLLSEIDSMVQAGLGAFHELDVANRQLVQSKELIETKSREATRIGAVEDQSRASLSKLLRAVEASKSSTLTTSRSAQIESRLRSTIHTLRDERDQSQQELATYRRKLSLAEEELRLTKSKLNRVMSEKHSMERDSRAAISLARSLDSTSNADMNYYKRKVGELSDKLQSSQRRVGELMERLNERSPKKKRSV